MTNYAAPLIALRKSIATVEALAALHDYDKALDQVDVALEQFVAMEVAIARLRDEQRVRVQR